MKSEGTKKTKERNLNCTFWRLSYLPLLFVQWPLYFSCTKLADQKKEKIPFFGRIEEGILNLWGKEEKTMSDKLNIRLATLLESLLKINNDSILLAK